MIIGVDVSYAGCCGFREIHSFQTDDGDGFYPDYRGETPAEVIENVLSDVDPGQLMYIWFKNPANWSGIVQPDNYEFDELRQYVRTIPGVVHLGEHINPNSNNQIDGYMFKKAAQ